jgi:hypothetical protein
MEKFMSVVAAGTAIIAKDLFKKLTSELYQLIRDRTGKKIIEFQSRTQISNIYKRIDQFKKVKTIWQIDKSVDLMEFYCDSHVVLNNARKKIIQLSDFGEEHRILIRGIAGQGKSIFLRYLCSVELINGKCIPLFLELRRISETYSLRNRIYAGFEALGITINDEIFHVLADSGKVLLLLDAFDEIPEEIKSQVLTDIEDLSHKYDKLRIIITSRPNQSIERSNLITAVNLDNLQGNEYKDVINKLADGKKWAKELVDHIEKKAVHVRDLLCTPLMVTLLVLSYKSFQKLPSKLSEFYDSLFQTLLQRHDGSKPGYTRQKKCNLDDSEYRQIFETLCILCKKSGLQTFSSKKIDELAKSAIESCNTKLSSAKYLDDIIKITCLILKEGDEHRYIHKTVQEYYTSSYIQKKPETWADTFYRKISSSRAEELWQQELEFLMEIDSYRYNKYYLLPNILALLKMSESDLNGDPPTSSIEQIKKVFGLMTFHYEKGHLSMIDELPTLHYELMGLGFMNVINRFDIDKLAASLNNKIILKDVDGPEYRENFINNPNEKIELRAYQKATLVDGIEADIIPEFIKFTDKEFEQLFFKAKKIYDSVKETENASILDGLL